MENSSQENQHWAMDQKARRVLLRAALQYGVRLAPNVVQEIFGVSRLRDFDGSLQDALNKLETYVADREFETYDSMALELPAPEHAEAKVIAFTEVVAPGGVTVHVTAREGATPTMIAATVLSLSQALRLLEPLGYKAS